MVAAGGHGEEELGNQLAPDVNLIGKTTLKQLVALIDGAAIVDVGVVNCQRVGPVTTSERNTGACSVVDQGLKRSSASAGSV